MTGGCKFCGGTINGRGRFCSRLCAHRFRKIGPANSLNLVEAAVMEVRRCYEPDPLASHLGYISSLVADGVDRFGLRPQDYVSAIVGSVERYGADFGVADRDAIQRIELAYERLAHRAQRNAALLGVARKRVLDFGADLAVREAAE